MCERESLSLLFSAFVSIFYFSIFYFLSSLFPLPFGVALADECLGALDPILAAECDAEGTPARSFSPASSAIVNGGAARPWPGATRAGTCWRFSPRACGLRRAMLGRDDLIHQAPSPVRSSRRSCRRSGSVRAPRMADTMGQTLGAAETGNQRQVDFRLAEARLLAGDDPGRTPSPVRPAAERETVDRRDNRDSAIPRSL